MWTSNETVGVFAPSAALLAVIISFMLSNRAENKRREQDLKRHQFDQDHDHRERLLQARLEAYREFSTRFSEHRRIYREMHQEWTAFQNWVGKVNHPDPLSLEQVLKFADESHQKWINILPIANAASEELRNALLITELVAGDKVLKDVCELAKLAEFTWEALRLLDDAYGDSADIQRWAELRKAEDRLDAGKAILLESIRDELHVETPRDSRGS